MSAYEIVDHNINQCDCCGKSKLMRTLHVRYNNTHLALGVVCAGKHFDLNLTGNPYKAAAKLERALNEYSRDEFEEHLEEILAE